MIKETLKTIIGGAALASMWLIPLWIYFAAVQG